MSTEQNVQIVKDFFAAAFGGDRAAMLALVADGIEWIIPGEDWPLAGTHRGHGELTDLLKTESETMEMSLSEPREFIAQGDRVLVVGYAEGKVKATNKPFKDDWIFAITVRDGKLTNIREYVDTQALARAAAMSDPESAGSPPEDRSDLRAS
jgi:ketosteroid isomerase-like protein